MENSDKELLARLANTIGTYIRALDHLRALEARHAQCCRIQTKLEMIELFDASTNESLKSRLKELVRQVIDETQTANKKVEEGYRSVISVELLTKGKTLADLDAYFSEEEAIRAEVDQMYDRVFGSRP